MLVIKKIFFVLLIAFVLHAQNIEDYTFELQKVVTVKGRQGIAADANFFYVSGSKSLYKYTRDWELVNENLTPFSKLKDSVNHIGDIDLIENKIVAGCEYFEGNDAKNLQVVFYDSHTLEKVKVIRLDPISGQKEICGLAFDRTRNIIWTADWLDGDYLYQYSISGKYLGKIKIIPPPKYQQGLYFFNKQILLTADDGNANLEEHDNLYSVLISDSTKASADVIWSKTFYEFKRTGEIEGLYVLEKEKLFLVLFNRGTRVVNGIPVGFYPGYEQEIHEVYIYKLNNKANHDDKN